MSKCVDPLFPPPSVTSKTNSAPVLTNFSMKHDAIVEQGIPILERVPIPEELIPDDSRVEIDAKIHAGYCKIASQYLYPQIMSHLGRLDADCPISHNRQGVKHE